MNYEHKNLLILKMLNIAHALHRPGSQTMCWREVVTDKPTPLQLTHFNELSVTFQ